MRSGSLAGQLRLMVITDRATAAPRAVAEVVRAALEGGATAIQLRDKAAAGSTLHELARELKTLTDRAGALLIVNDRVDVAIAVGADGAHIGPDDPPLERLRPVVPEGFLLGVSTDSPDEARRAERGGADYIGSGAVYTTPSKADAGEIIGPEGVARVVASVGIPVVAIGGIDATRAESLRGTGAAGCAVIGAVMGAPDPAAAARELLLRFGA